MQIFFTEIYQCLGSLLQMIEQNFIALECLLFSVNSYRIVKCNPGSVKLWKSHSKWPLSESYLASSFFPPSLIRCLPNIPDDLQHTSLHKHPCVWNQMILHEFKKMLMLEKCIPVGFSHFLNLFRA